MFAPQLIQGRWLGVEDLEALQRLIAEHPHWSRRRLSIARLLLNKLAERGFIKLHRGSAVADVRFCVRSQSPNSLV